MVVVCLQSPRALADTCEFNGVDESDCQGGGPDDICQISGTTIVCDLTRNRDDEGGIARAYTNGDYWEISGTPGGGVDFCCIFSRTSSITGLQVVGTSYNDDIQLRCDSSDTLGSCSADYELTPASSGTLIGSVSGNDGSDTINGSNHDSPTTYWDQLHGGDGDDTINGLGGNDEVWGDLDSDTIRGGDGADILRGNDQDDYISGGGGQDTLYGGNHDDTLCGDDEPSTSLIDLLNGEGGDDLLWGPDEDCGDDSTGDLADHNGGNGGPGYDHADNCSYPSYINTEDGLDERPLDCPTP